MIDFKLVSLEGVKFEDKVYEVILPTIDGEIAVLDKHMPLVSVAKRGILSVRHKSGDLDDFLTHFAISGGAIEVSDNILRVLVDEADSEEDISEEEAKEAMKRAEALKKEAKDQVSLDNAQSLIDRSAVRLQLAGLKRRNRRR